MDETEYAFMDVCYLILIQGSLPIIYTWELIIGQILSDLMPSFTGSQLI